MVKLVEARQEDMDTLLGFLALMAGELEEFAFDCAVVAEAVRRSFTENVHWFLFCDSETGEAFGACYCQSVHNYWRLEKRFYLGGVYVTPEHRGTGHFENAYGALRQWVKDNGGVQLYAHIHKDNRKSINAFRRAGMEEIDYRLFADHWED